MPVGKEERLRDSGTYNSRHAKVSDPDFEKYDTLDPRDLLQVRYEIVRAIDIGGEPAADVAGRFGVSVVSARRYVRSMRDGGIAALVPKKRGPRGPHALGEEGEAFVEKYLEAHPSASAGEVHGALEGELSTGASRRTVERRIASKKAGGGRPRS